MSDITPDKKTIFAPRESLNKWLEALRSGLYFQIPNTLRMDRGDKIGYCCLGVCEQVVSGSVEEDEDLPSDSWLVHNNIQFTSVSYNGGNGATYAKTYANAPSVYVERDDLDPVDARTIHNRVGSLPCWVSVTVLNDAGVPFPTIAKLIERHSQANDG